MRIVFDKADLLNKLLPAMGTVSTKNTISSIEGVLIDADNEGRVRLSTYDMNKGVRSFMTNATVEESGSYIINASRLLQYVKVMPATGIVLEVDSGLNAKLYSGKSSFSLFAFKGSDFPSLPELTTEKGFQINSGILKKMINKVIHSIAVQETRPMLCGAFFNISGSRMEVVSCDSYTLSKCSVSCDITSVGAMARDQFAFIIPGHALNELVRMLPEDETITVFLSQKHAIFRMNEMTFFTRMIDSEYIDYERIIPREQTIKIKIDRARLLEGLERAGIVAEEKVQGGRSHVKVVVSGDMLSLTSSSVNGKVYDEMSCEHEGEDIEIGFNCRYLINSVRAADSETVYVTFKSPKSSITIEPVEKKEDSDFFYMVLPVRMNEA